MDYHALIGRLEEIERDLANRQADGETAADDFHERKREHELRWAQTYLETQGTVEERRQQTILKLYGSQEYKQFIAAQAQYDGWKAVNRVLEARASVAQSLLRAQTRETQQGGQQPSWSNAA